MKPVHRGVPQGSVAGPLFYAIFTNEMSEIVKNRACQDPVHLDRSTLFGSQCQKCGIMSLYADDSTFLVGSRNRNQNQTTLSRNLDEIKCFLYDNQLLINVEKTSLTEFMIYQKKAKTPGPPPSLIVQKVTGVDKTIEDSNYTRVLGANLQANLTWQAHLETGNKALLPAVRK